MYKVIVDGVFAGYSDTAIFIKLHENGCYVPCDKSEAQGVCVKLPYEFQSEEGSSVSTVKDTVFSLSKEKMAGNEQVAQLEHVNGASLLNEAETIVSILTGGAE